MRIAERFMAYAAAFEQSYADDDWARLEPFFTDDAVYAVNGGPPMGGRFEGRRAVLHQLHQVVDALDRRFDARKVELVDGPRVDGHVFEMRWRATYEAAGLPDLSFEGTERATFEGDAIRLLEDVVDDGTDACIQAHLARLDAREHEA